MTTRVDLHTVVTSHNYTYLVLFNGEHFHQSHRTGLSDTTNFFMDCPPNACISPDFHIDRLLYYMDDDKSKLICFPVFNEEFQPELDVNNNNFIGHRTIFMTLENPSFCQRVNVWLEPNVKVLCVEGEVPIFNSNAKHIYHLCGFTATNLYAEF